MRDMRVGTDVTVFLLFFGLALVDAIQSRSWPRIALWFALGAVFLWADLSKRGRDDRTNR